MPWWRWQCRSTRKMATITGCCKRRKIVLPLSQTEPYLYFMSDEPKYKKTILCLANSRKLSGRCIAGKEVDGGKIGSWIRPVSDRASHEISENDMQYENGQSAKLLDIITIPMIEPRPHAYQTENHLIAADYYWVSKSRATWQQVVAGTDAVQGSLWPNGDSSYHGSNDKVAQAIANGLPNSLLLIEPAKLDLFVGKESVYGGGSKRAIRATFTFNKAQYRFMVTDPWIEEKYFGGPDGTYPIENCRLCVSLAEIIGGSATKLVAAVITPDRIG